MEKIIEKMYDKVVDQYEKHINTMETKYQEEFIELNNSYGKDIKNTVKSWNEKYINIEEDLELLVKELLNHKFITPYATELLNNYKEKYYIEIKEEENK